MAYMRFVGPRPSQGIPSLAQGTLGGHYIEMLGMRDEILARTCITQLIMTMTAAVILNLPLGGGVACDALHFTCYYVITPIIASFILRLTVVGYRDSWNQCVIAAVHSLPFYRFLLSSSLNLHPPLPIHDSLRLGPVSLTARNLP